MKETIKKKGFWAAVAGIIVIALQMFGVKAPLPYVNEIISGVCAVLVMLGLMTAADKRIIDDELGKTTKTDKAAEEDTKIDTADGKDTGCDENDEKGATNGKPRE